MFTWLLLKIENLGHDPGIHTRYLVNIRALGLNVSFHRME
jgi:hypothetical protein